MKKNGEKLTPVLLGADLNAYSVALAFHEAFGVKSYAMGRYKCGLTRFSKIVKIEFCSGYGDIDVFLPELISFARKHIGEELILVPCADSYVEFITQNRAELSRFYKFYVPDGKLIERLTNKAEFYRAIKRFDIPFPDFFVFKFRDYRGKCKSDFGYPAVLKPAVSAEYWRSPFPEMKKVYYPETEEEVKRISETIYGAGYRGELILQEKIENPEIYVYTAFITPEGRSDFGVFGKVILEEMGKTSAGNHSAIITEKENEICQKLKGFLRSVGYYGFANFDILKSNGSFYVLELNARQGRSCDHIRCAGINLAERLISSIKKEGGAYSDCYRKIYWHYPSHKTVMRYAVGEDAAEACRLKKGGFEFEALNYRPDLSFNPIRRAYVNIHSQRLASAFSLSYSSKSGKE